MKSKKVKHKSEIKLVFLTFILSFIGGYVWQGVIRTVVAVYQSKKLGSSEAGTAYMNKLLTTNLTFQLIAYMGMELVILLIACSIIKKYNEGKFNLDLIGMKFKKRSVKQLFLGVGIALLMQFILYVALTIFGYAKYIGSDFVNYPILNVFVSIIIALGIGASAGFVEEILFRGIILKYLMNKKGKVFALIISSLAFSIYHAGRLDPILMLQAFLIGIVLGYLYIITDSIYLSIGLHSGWDFCSSIIKNGDSLFNIKSVFIFNVAKSNNTILNISPIILYLIVRISAFIIYKRKKDNLSLVSENNIDCGK